MAPSLTQSLVLRKIEKLVNLTTNFPSLIHLAEANCLLNQAERDAICTKYKSLADKLTTFYLLSSRKPDLLLSLLGESGNSEAQAFLLSEEVDEDFEILSPKRDAACHLISDNLEKICSHTNNPSLVLSYATGMNLINATERELIARQCRCEEEELAAFYTLVASKGPQAVENLAQLLKMTNNHWALKVLERD